MQREERASLTPAERPPGYGRFSSAAAPIALIGGWTLAEARQPTFDPVAQSISALAGAGAHEPWIMTGALFGVGLCHLASAAALSPAAPAGRILLAVGGLGTLAVAALPLPAQGSSLAHMLAASAALGALALWPLVAASDRADPPFPLRPRVSIGAGAALLAGLAWLGAELWTGGARLGLAERVLAGAEALWPWVVVRGWRAKP